LHLEPEGSPEAGLLEVVAGVEVAVGDLVEAEVGGLDLDSDSGLGGSDLDLMGWDSVGAVVGDSYLGWGLEGLGLGLDLGLDSDLVGLDLAEEDLDLDWGWGSDLVDLDLGSE